jgi:hypothetical protein
MSAEEPPEQGGPRIVTPAASNETVTPSTPAPPEFIPLASRTENTPSTNGQSGRDGSGAAIYGSGSNGVTPWSSNFNINFSIDMNDSFWGAFFGFGQKSTKAPTGLEEAFPALAEAVTQIACVAVENPETKVPTPIVRTTNPFIDSGTETKPKASTDTTVTVTTQTWYSISKPVTINKNSLDSLKNSLESNQTIITK